MVRARARHLKYTILKLLATCLSCAALLTGSAAAELPKKMPVSHYSRLWTDFMCSLPSKDSSPRPGPQLADEYALAGISPINGGYRVTLMKRKNPELRTTIDTDAPDPRHKILAVSRKSGDFTRTTVTLALGEVTGTIGFDEALLARPKSASPPQQQVKTQHPPRPRVVPPGQP